MMIGLASDKDTSHRDKDLDKMQVAISDNSMNRK